MLDRTLKCALFFHKYKNIKVIEGVYSTALTWDEYGDCGTIYYDVYLIECTKCKTRKTVVIGGAWKDHSGLKKLKYKREKLGEL